MKNFYCFKFEILLTTIIFIFLSIIYGAFINIIIFYILTLIHELGHFLAATFFKVRCHKITFHPLGFSLDMENISFTKPHKQLIIFLSGPLTFFISYLLIQFFYRFNFLSNYQYYLALENNLSLLLFNLIPLYPLDGGKILEVILLKFLPSRNAKKIRNYFSLFTSILLIWLCIVNYQILLMCFIVFSISSSLLFFNREYKQYLYSRIGNVTYFNKKISSIKNILHFNHNFLMINNNLKDEEDYILNLKLEELNKNI